MVEQIYTSPQVDKRGFNPNVHGARGLFSLLVVLFHVGFSKLPYPSGVNVQVYEFLAFSFAYAVELFFIISGFVIAGAFQRASSIGKFMLDRMTRIYPVLWVTCTVTLLLLLLQGGFLKENSLPEKALIYVGNLLALPPVVQIPLIHPAAWSLSYEFAFYLVFCIYGLGTRFLRRDVVLIGIAALAIFAFTMHIRAIYFIPGLLIAAGSLDRPLINNLSRFPFLFMCIFFGAWQTVALMVGGNIHAAVLGRMIQQPVVVPFAFVAFCAATIAMHGIVRGHGILSMVLRSRVFQFLGTISFSLYLWQTPILAVVKRAITQAGLDTLAGGFAQALFLALALPPILLVSHFSQILLEEKARRYLRNMTERTAAWRAAQ